MARKNHNILRFEYKQSSRMRVNSQAPFCRPISTPQPPRCRGLVVLSFEACLFFDCSSIVFRFEIEEQSKKKRRTIEEETSPWRARYEEAPRPGGSLPRTGGSCPFVFFNNPAKSKSCLCLRPLFTGFVHNNAFFLLLYGKCFVLLQLDNTAHPGSYCLYNKLTINRIQTYESISKNAKRTTKKAIPRTRNHHGGFQSRSGSDSERSVRSLYR